MSDLRMRDISLDEKPREKMMKLGVSGIGFITGSFIFVERAFRNTKSFHKRFSLN